jgi:hypothetical protein
MALPIAWLLTSTAAADFNDFNETSIQRLHKQEVVVERVSFTYP